MTGVVFKAFNWASVRVVDSMVKVASGKAPATSWNEPLSTSPLPAARVPVGKLDSSTPPSVPATVPSFRPTMAGTPTMVTVSVVVALLVSPSCMA